MFPLCEILFVKLWLILSIAAVYDIEESVFTSRMPKNLAVLDPVVDTIDPVEV